MKKQLLFSFILSLSLFSNSSYGQDVWLQNHFAPSSGCGLSSSESVNVLINNNSGVVMPSNSVYVSYTVDGGSATQQFLSSNLFPGASWNFSFNANADLSVCGAHKLKVWVNRPGDSNRLNDTLQWTVTNDCPVIPGSVIGSATVCKGDNDGTLKLTGRSNGVILGWESSTDGNNWTDLKVIGDTYLYKNVAQTTSYRVQIDGGLCPDDISSTGKLTTTSPVAGTIAGSDSVSTSTASGKLTLSGASGALNFWESSTNLVSWKTISNKPNTLQYNNLTQTTWYRANTDGGICPAVYSDTAVIYFYPVTGISDAVSYSSGVKVYPNPASDKLTITADVLIREIVLTDMLGKPVLRLTAGSQRVDLDVSHISAGIYVLEVNDEGGKTIEKLIVE